MFERQIDIRYLRLFQSNRIICGFAWAAMAVSHMLSVKRDTDWQSQQCGSLHRMKFLVRIIRT